MRLKGVAAVLVTVATPLAVPALAAGGDRVLLPSTATPLDARLPLSTSLQPEEQVFPPAVRITGRQRVAVGIDETGAPRTIGVRQRLTLTGTGDYSFVVPAPLIDVLAAPGSDAVPGRRQAGIVWQGFLDGQRVLSADAALRATEAAEALPLRLGLVETVDGQPLRSGGPHEGSLRVTLRISNDTALRVRGFDAPAATARIAPILDRIRRAARRGSVLPDLFVPVDGAPRARTFVVDAPMLVVGELRLRAATLDGVTVSGGRLTRSGRTARVTFRLVLGGASSSATVAIECRGRGIAPSSLSLTARPVARLPGLEPPGAATWSDATAHGRPEHARSLVALASRSILGLARVRQFDTFLAVPRGGDADAVYEYRSLPTPATATAAPDGPSERVSGTLIVVVAGVLAMTAALVVWAHL